MAISPKDISSDYILSRRAAIMRSADASKRIQRMDKYEQMYRMDVYRDARSPDQVRVSMPVAAETVEKMRALLVTRPAVVTVPFNSADPADQHRGQQLEQWLYGALSRANFQKVLFDAEWFAMCLGLGVIRYHYDPEVPEDDFPIILSAPDPRTVFGLENAQRDRFVECVHTWDRSRREIESEFGVKLSRPADLAPEAVAAHLDGLVSYTEYWLEVQSKEKQPASEPVEETMAERVAKAMQRQMAAQAGLDPDAPELQADEPAQVTRRVRKIYHAIIVGDAFPGEIGARFIKKPVLMKGFSRIPFVFWAGTSTPLPGANSHLSVLFPLSNGDAGDQALGVLAAQNALASLDIDSALRAPNAPLWTDDPNAQIDTSPDAVNKLQPGSTLQRVNTDVTNAAVMRGLELMTGQAARHTVPSILSGDNVQQLSGQAISGYATVFQMLVGYRQKERERALELLCAGVLRLVEEWADPDEGLSAWGVNALGGYVDATIKPEDIGGVYRVQVKLSASMPKDDVGMISLLSMLQEKGQYSMESLLDQVQKLIGIAADSPEDELVRILRDKWITEGDFVKQMAQLLSADYIDLILGRAGGGVTPEQIAQAKALMMPQPAQQGAGGAPGQGMPQGGMAEPPMPQGAEMPAGAMNGMPAGMMPGGGAPMGMPMPAGMSPDMEVQGGRA